MSKPHIYDLDYKNFISIMGTLQGSQYTTDVWRDLYRQYADEFHHMVSIPSELRTQLDERFSLVQPKCVDQIISADGNTRKDLLVLEDGQYIEVVLLRYGDRLSACVSTQVGCACNCAASMRCAG